jgi:SAM-dependent methyltransferase
MPDLRYLSSFTTDLSAGFQYWRTFQTNIIFMKSIVEYIFGIYEKLIQVLLGPIFYKENKYPLKRKNERANEFAFAFNCIAEKSPDSLLDVGTGKTSFPHLVQNCGIHVTAIDKIKGYWSSGFSNRHFRVHSDDITNPRIGKKFDMITCISVLEHIPTHREALKGMFSLLNPGGQIILTFPYNEHTYHPDIYRHPDAGYGQHHAFIGQVYSRNEINQWLADNGGVILKQIYYEAFTGEFWTMGDSIYPLRQTNVTSRHHLTCLLLSKS